MNDAHDGPDAHEATASERELGRRLGNLATLAAVDDGAWDRFQVRLADSQPSHRSWPRLRLTPKQVLAIAAAVVAVCALVVIQDDDGDRMRTVDDTTTTTSGRSTTTSTTRPDDRTTTTAAGADGVPGGSAQGGSGGPGGSGGGGSGPQPDASGGTQGPGDTPGTSAPGSAAPAPTGPSGPTVAVTYPTPDYTLQATFEARGTTFILDVTRVGGSHVADWVVADQPGHNCLRGENQAALDLPEPGPHLYSWGVVRSDAAEVRVVTTSGDWTTAVLGAEVAPGLRAWIARRYTEQIAHFEALDSAGNVLHTAQWDTPQDTC